jgi:hypothetical protein
MTRKKVAIATNARYGRVSRPQEDPMPILETVEELAEALADMMGIYQQALQAEGRTIQETRERVAQTGDRDFDHADTCGCRQCWCGHMERRIRAAVAHERLLDGAQLPPSP